MDNILEESFPEWEKRAPYNFASHDRDGRPSMNNVTRDNLFRNLLGRNNDILHCFLITAMVTGMGQLDVRKVALAGQAKELERYLLYGYERGLYNVANGGNSTYYFIDGEGAY